MKFSIIILILLANISSAFANSHLLSSQLPGDYKTAFATGHKNLLKQEPAQTDYNNIFYTAHRPETDSLPKKTIKRKAKWAKWLGIGSLIGLIIPFVDLLCLPAAIAAIVIGHHVQKESGYNKDASTGIRAGWAAVGILLVVGFIVAIVTLPLGPR